MKQRTTSPAAALLACLLAVPAFLPAASSAARRPKCFGQVATKVGTAGNDIINGTKRRDVIVSKGGDDQINGRGGNDLICSGGGSDVAFGGRGKDKVKGGRGADVLLGQGGPDVLKGGGGGDIILGGGRNDRLLGGGGDDQLQGNAGDDLLKGGDSAGHLDLASFFDASGPVTVDVPAGQASGAGVGTDTLVGMEDFETGFFDDTLMGGPLSDGLFGHGGNDTLTGGAGDDFLSPGDGNDSVDGEANGAQGDLVDYFIYALVFDHPDPVDVDLGAGEASGQGTDILTGIENVIGTPHNDTLTGDGSSNFLVGMDGNDTLAALDGDDFLDGDCFAFLAGPCFVNADGTADVGDGGEGEDFCQAIETSTSCEGGPSMGRTVTPRTTTTAITLERVLNGAGPLHWMK
jgi:Ca2+-binding RTX toxin-like protein